MISRILPPTSKRAINP